MYIKLNLDIDMSIDEVIAHARTDMEFYENQVEFLKLEGYTLSDTVTTQIYESIRYNKSIVALLEDLKMLRLSSCRVNMQERLQLVENGYNKAIDDFVNEFINGLKYDEAVTYVDSDEYLAVSRGSVQKLALKIAEQLKGRERE